MLIPTMYSTTYQATLRLQRDLWLHFEQHLSGRAIALAVQCALSSVQECLRRFVASDLSWPVTLDE